MEMFHWKCRREREKLLDEVAALEAKVEMWVDIARHLKDRCDALKVVAREAYDGEYHQAKSEAGRMVSSGVSCQDDEEEGEATLEVQEGPGED